MGGFVRIVRGPKGMAVVRVKRGGGSVEFPEMRPTFTGTKSSDPSSVVSSYSFPAPGIVRAVMQNPGSISRLPHTAALFPFPLYDIAGRALDDSVDVDLGDVIVVTVWAPETVADTDLLVGAGISLGQPDGSDVLLGPRLRANAGVWEVGHQSAAAGVPVDNGAGATSSLCLGATAIPYPGTAGTQGRVNAHGRDGAGLALQGANVASAPTSVTGQGNYNMGYLSLGWDTGVGGVPGEYEFGVSYAIFRPWEVPSFNPFP